MGRAVSASRCRAPACGWLLVSAVAALTPSLAAAADQPEPSLRTITSLRELMEASSHGQRSSYHIHLEGTVLWSSSKQDWIALEDGSGAEELEFDHDHHSQPLRPGERVRIEGN